MQEVIDDVKKLGIGKESEGAYLVFFDNDKYPPLMLLKSSDIKLSEEQAFSTNYRASTYALRDLAADKFRKKKYGKDVVIVNEVGMEQNLHFKQIFETEKLLGYTAGPDRVHVAHGLYRFPEGKMSTRKGNGIWLEEILDEAVEKAKEFDKETAEVVGVGAIKNANDLKRESSGDIVFNWDEILNLKGDSGPYLQYSYARAKSILRKAKDAKIKIDVKIKSAEKREVSELEKILYRFPEVVEASGKRVFTALYRDVFDRTRISFNAFYAKNKIVDERDIFSPYKVALTEAFSLVVKNGLNLLGIQARRDEI